MTISPSPRVFDLSSARPVGRPVLPALDRTFWHCTPIRHLDEILRTGLIPEKSNIGHTCLATDPAAALFFGRCEHAMWGDPVLDAPVMLRIPGALLDPKAICPESGCASGAPYGSDLPWRSLEVVRVVKDDALALMGVVDALGYRQTLSITADMVDTRPQDLPAMSCDEFSLELALGRPVQPETQAYIAQLEAEEAQMPAAA